MSHVKALQAVAGDHTLLLAAASQSWDRRILGADSFLPPGQEIPTLDSSTQLIALPRQVKFPCPRDFCSCLSQNIEIPCLHDFPSRYVSALKKCLSTLVQWRNGCHWWRCTQLKFLRDSQRQKPTPISNREIVWKIEWHCPRTKLPCIFTLSPEYVFLRCCGAYIPRLHQEAVRPVQCSVCLADYTSLSIQEASKELGISPKCYSQCQECPLVSFQSTHGRSASLSWREGMSAYNQIHQLECCLSWKSEMERVVLFPNSSREAGEYSCNLWPLVSPNNPKVFAVTGWVPQRWNILPKKDWTVLGIWEWSTSCGGVCERIAWHIFSAGPILENTSVVPFNPLEVSMRYAAPAVLKCCAEIGLEVDLLSGHSHGSLVVNSLASLFKRLGKECSVIFLDPRTTENQLWSLPMSTAYTSVQNVSYPLFRLSGEFSFSAPFVPHPLFKEAFKEAERLYQEDVRISPRCAMWSDALTAHMKDANHAGVPKFYDIVRRSNKRNGRKTFAFHEKEACWE